MAETPRQFRTVAVIDIGTSAIRLVVAEVGPKNEIRYLENLQRPVRFGRDVFSGGRLTSAAIREGIDILKDFKTVIDGYGVTGVEAIASSAVREAVNRDNFIDQVFVRTGIDVEVIEGAEENRLELIAVQHALDGKVDLDKKNCLILEIGSGSTEMMILNQGRVEITRTLSLGSMRLPEQAIPGKTDPATLQRVLKRSIHDVVVHAAHEYSFNQVDTFIALGGDMRFAAQQLTQTIDDRYAVLDKKGLLDFVAQLVKKYPEEIANEYGVPLVQAETLIPALLGYANFLAETNATSVIVPMVSIRDGILVEQAQLLSGYKRTDVARQVINSARHLAQRYHYDKPHVACVSSLALKLFDVLREDHGMGTKGRLLLEAAAVLHDIGTYISPSAHHKHSSYLVGAADIFGLRKTDKLIVSNIVRYHRRAVPRMTHVEYMSLPKYDRAVVSKLAAILRVADALDHSHQQKIKDFELERQRESYVLWIGDDVGDISVERASLKDKGEMFAEVFGAPIQLKQRRSTR